MIDSKEGLFELQAGSCGGLPGSKVRGQRHSLSLRSGNSGGLTVLGSESNCGKTAFMTGLTAIMRQQGFTVRAVKPVCIGPRERGEAELSFISSITGTPKNYPAVFVASAKNFSHTQWSQAISICLNSRDLTMVEAPSSLASAMTVKQSDENGLTSCWKDSTDFAVELHFPVVIVAKHNEEAIERLVLSWSYAKNRGLDVVGLVTVETVLGQGALLESRLTRSEVDLLLQSRTEVPYLGCLKFSPSISVHRVNQGNLVKMTESGVDLMPVLRALQPVVAKW